MTTTLLLSSCQREDMGATESGEVNFTVTAGIPAGITTYAEDAFSHQGGAINVDPTQYDLRYILEVYTEDEVTEAEDEKKVTLLSGQVALEQLINGQISQVVWNKLYRKSIIENIYFEVGKYHEDEFWSYQVIGKARKVSLTEHIGYYYRQRQGSIMDEAYSVRRLDAIEAKCRRQVYLEKNYPKLISCGKMNLLFACLYHGQLALCSMSRSERISIHKYLQKTMRKNHLSKSEKREIPLKYKTWLVSANYTFTFVCWIRNLLRIGL